jgi:flagellar biosynthesis GTPase FlhF
MKNIFNKTNAPYLASGALAIGTLLTSGIFAVAPYIGFLAPVAALSLGLPFVIGGVVFSAAAIALSAVVIQKNGAIRRQSALLDEEVKEKAELTLKSEEKDAQLTKKKAEVQAQKQENSELKTQLAEKDAKISSLEKRLDENEAFHDVVEEREAEISSLKEQLDEKKNEAKALKTRLAKDAKISDLRERLANGAKLEFSPELLGFLSKNLFIIFLGAKQ